MAKMRFTFCRKYRRKFGPLPHLLIFFRSFFAGFLRGFGSLGSALGNALVNQSDGMFYRRGAAGRSWLVALFDMCFSHPTHRNLNNDGTVMCS